MIGDFLNPLRAVLLWFGLTLATISSAAKAEECGALALVNARVIADDFASWREDQTLLIADGLIVAVGPGGEIEIPEGAQTIDLSGKMVIPGLWDAHVHTRYDGIDHLRLLLLHGITSLRDMGGPWTHLDRMKQWREEIASGERLGPRIWTAGTVLDNPGANWAHITVVHSPTEAREAVRKLKAEGADFVKVYSNLTPENYFAIIDEARLQDLPVHGHLPDAIAPDAASRAGQHTVEHADVLALALASGPAELDARGQPLNASLVGRIDPDKARLLAGVFKANDTYLVPTLSVMEHYTTLSTDTERARANPALRFIPAPYLKEWSAMVPRDPSEWQASALLARDITRLMHENGVPIVAGTDTVKPYFVPGDALHYELALLVKAGLSEGEAIRAATLTPARMMGVADSGLIEPGYMADLLVLNADPLADIANTRAIAAVVSAGRLIDRSDLDRIAGEIAAAAAQWNGLPSGRDR